MQAGTHPEDLYFVWRDYGPMIDLNRGWLGGTDVAELQKAGGPIEDAAGVGRQLATFAVREGMDPYAGLVPARRVLRIDPAQSLRQP